MNAIWSLIAKINHDDNGDDDNRRMMICTPSLDDRWEGLDGHWLGEDTINPFTPPAPPAHSPPLLPQPPLCTNIYSIALELYSYLKSSYIPPACRVLTAPSLYISP